MRQMLSKFNALSQKARLIIIAGFLLISLVIFFNLLLIPRSRLTKEINSKIEKSKARLSRVGQLASEYKRLKAKIGGVEKNIRPSRPGLDISTLLTKEAEDAGIGDKVVSVTSSEAVLGDRYKELTVKLTFSGISTSQLVRYLHKVKGIEGLIDIKRLRIKGETTGGGKTLKVEVDVATLVKL